MTVRPGDVPCFPFLRSPNCSTELRNRALFFAGQKWKEKKKNIKESKK